MGANLSSLPIAILGGTPSKRFDVVVQAGRALTHRVGDDTVVTARVECPPMVDSLSWADFDIAGRATHHESRKMQWYLNELLVSDDDSPVRQAGFVFCADSLLTVYCDMTKYCFDLSRRVRAMIAVYEKTGATLDQSALIELEATMRSMVEYQQLMRHEASFWLGGVFLVGSNDPPAVEKENGDMEGSPEAVERYTAEHLLDWLGVSYVKLSADVKPAGNTMAEFLTESLGLERSPDVKDLTEEEA